MRIVGIDPGTTKIGYALISGTERTPHLLRAETIEIAPHLAAAERLRDLAQELEKRLRRDRPEVVAVEKLFFAKNTRTALAVAEARGIILLTAEKHARSIWEYTPLEVKMAVTGYGRADKLQLYRMIRRMFPPTEVPLDDDAVDAIAIALTALFRRQPRDQ